MKKQTLKQMISLIFSAAILIGVSAGNLQPAEKYDNDVDASNYICLVALDIPNINGE